MRTSLRNRVAAKALLLQLGLTAALARPQITEVITASNAAIHLGWYVASINEKVAHTFVNHATQLNNLRAYDRRPWTMVLPAFSHKSREHLSLNMMALHVVMPEMLKLMAAWKVAFIYSASVIGSALLECYIPDLLRRVGLGAIQAPQTRRALAQECFLCDPFAQRRGLADAGCPHQYTGRQAGLFGAGGKSVPLLYQSLAGQLHFLNQVSRACSAQMLLQLRGQHVDMLGPQSHF